MYEPISSWTGPGSTFTTQTYLNSDVKSWNGPLDVGVSLLDASRVELGDVVGGHFAKASNVAFAACESASTIKLASISTTVAATSPTPTPEIFAGEVCSFQRYAKM